MYGEPGIAVHRNGIFLVTDFFLYNDLYSTVVVYVKIKGRGSGSKLKFAVGDNVKVLSAAVDDVVIAVACRLDFIAVFGRNSRVPCRKDKTVRLVGGERIVARVERVCHKGFGRGIVEYILSLCHGGNGIVIPLTLRRRGYGCRRICRESKTR